MEMGRDEEKTREKDGGRFFFSNLAQEEAIFLVLLCQINAALQLFFLTHCDIKVTVFITVQKKQKYIFIAKSLQRSSANLDFICVDMCT